jgi:adenylylsulfate kinase
MSWAIWITGPPGSGKSTIAQNAVIALEKRGVTAVLLESAAFCAALVPARTPLEWELDIVYRALVYTAAVVTRAGIPVIIDATAPRREWRDMARASIPHFAEVQLVCPPEICGARERTARWSRTTLGAHRPDPAGPDPEIVLTYEHSLRAELTVDTQAQHVWTAVEHVLLLADRLVRKASSPRTAAG